MTCIGQTIVDDVVVVDIIIIIVECREVVMVVASSSSGTATPLSRTTSNLAAHHSLHKPFHLPLSF